MFKTLVGFFGDDLSRFQ